MRLQSRIEFEWMFVVGFFVVGFHMDGVEIISNREYPNIPSSFLITHESLVSQKNGTKISQRTDRSKRPSFVEMVFSIENITQILYTVWKS